MRAESTFMLPPSDRVGIAQQLFIDRQNYLIKTIEESMRTKSKLNGTREDRENCLEYIEALLEVSLDDVWSEILEEAFDEWVSDEQSIGPIQSMETRLRLSEFAQEFQNRLDRAEVRGDLLAEAHNEECDGCEECIC